MDLLIDGFVEKGFEPVLESFHENFAKRREIGASVCVYHEGRKVVDLWGGHQDLAKTQPWQEDTNVLMYSTTKGMAATAIALAHSQGLFEWDEPVCKYWPEFAANGKENITVRQLFSHQAGLPALDQKINIEIIANKEKLAQMLAQQKPLWQPGEFHGYHLMTMGWYQSEFLYRVDGRYLSQYFQEEIAEPQGLTFYMGSDAPRAEVDGYSVFGVLTNLRLFSPHLVWNIINPFSITGRTFHNPRIKDPSLINSQEFQSLEIPSSNGVGTVRSVAKVYGLLAMGGSELGLKPKTFEDLIAEPLAPARKSKDLVMGGDTRYSLGFMRPSSEFSFGQGKGSLGTPGLGGSFGFADPLKKLSFAYAPNSLGYAPWNDIRERSLRDSVYRSLNS